MDYYKIIKYLVIFKLGKQEWKTHFRTMVDNLIKTCLWYFLCRMDWPLYISKLSLEI